MSRQCTMTLAALAMALAACGGGGGSGSGSGFKPGVARPSAPQAPASGKTATGPETTADPVAGAGAILSGARTLIGSRVHMEDGSTREKRVSSEDAGPLVRAPASETRAAVPAVRTVRTLAPPAGDVFGGWLRHSGFGVRRQQLDDGHVYGRYAMALGAPVKIVPSGNPFALPDMVWEGIMVGVAATGEFHRTSVSGRARVAFRNGRNLAGAGETDTGEADAAIEAGLIDITFTGIRSEHDGSALPDIGFTGVPVTVSSAEGGGVALAFSGGGAGASVEGAFFGATAPDEVAGVFERAGIVGAFGANLESRDDPPGAVKVDRAAGIVTRSGVPYATRGHDAETFAFPVEAAHRNANPLAVAPPWSLPEDDRPANWRDEKNPAKPFDMVRVEGSGNNAFGGWLRHSGFGILSIPGLGPTGSRAGYAMATGDHADIRIARGTPSALAHMSWEGNMVAVQPGGNSARHGTVTLSFTGNGLDLDLAEVGAETGALDVTLTVAGDSLPKFRFDNVPVTLREKSGATGGRDHAASLEFGQGPPDNRIEGGIYGGHAPDEAAGVFEQGGWYGAFGANIENSPAFIPHRVWDGIHEVFEPDIPGFQTTTPTCTNLSCGFNISWLPPAEGDETPERETQEVAVEVVRHPDGRDFRFVARDIERGTDSRSYGAWGNWSWFQASQGEVVVEREDDSAIVEFGIPVSQGFSSPAFPAGKTGTATWTGKMAGIAYNAAGDPDNEGRKIIEAVEGNASLTVKFEDDVLDLRLSGIKAHAGFESYADIEWTGVGFEDGRFRSPKHSLSGGFYGPEREEVGGIFRKVPEGDEAGIVGAFGAKR